MRLKLTKNQLEALYNLFLNVVVPLKPCTLPDQLIYRHLFRVFKKMRTKVECFNPKSGYSVGLTDEEALAYWAYFASRDLLDQQYHYEAIFIQEHLNEIDKKYA